MNPKLKTALKILSNVPVVIVVVLALLLHGAQLFGLKTYSVLSGSMESVYPTGSLIYVATVDPEKLEQNDVITYRKPGSPLVTHRIVEILQDADDPNTFRFRTKGDENEDADGPLVEYSDVIGKVVFCVPGLGRFATDIAHPPGKYYAIAGAVALVLLEIIMGILLEEPKQTDKSKEKEISK